MADVPPPQPPFGEPVPLRGRHMDRASDLRAAAEDIAGVACAALGTFWFLTRWFAVPVYLAWLCYQDLAR